MKKKFLYTAIFAAMISMTSCNEDFNADVAAPQAWEQEEMIETASMTITPVADINLETITEETVKLFNYQVTGQIEGSTIENLKAYVSKQDAEAWQKIEIDNSGNTTVEVLQKTIEGLYGKKDDMRTLNLKAEASMNIDGQAVYLSAEKISINVTPKKPLIVPEYYIVGNIQGWSQEAKTCALYPVSLETSTFTYTTDFSNGGAGDPNFKIWSAADFGNNNWDLTLGTQIDGDTSLEGTLVQGNVGAIKTPDNSIYTLTVNLIDMTYIMAKEENQSPTEYTTIGMIGFNGWDTDVDMTLASPHNWYYQGLIIEAESPIKFRANDIWDDSWGGSINLNEEPFGTSIYNSSDNMTIPAGTYDVFFNDITGQFAFFAR